MKNKLVVFFGRSGATLTVGIVLCVVALVVLVRSRRTEVGQVRPPVGYFHFADGRPVALDSPSRSATRPNP